jgi:hypothetical protein
MILISSSSFISLLGSISIIKKNERKKVLVVYEYNKYYKKKYQEEVFFIKKIANLLHFNIIFLEQKFNFKKFNIFRIGESLKNYSYMMKAKNYYLNFYKKNLNNIYFSKVITSNSVLCGFLYPKIKPSYYVFHGYGDLIKLKKNLGYIKSIIDNFFNILIYKSNIRINKNIKYYSFFTKNYKKKYKNLFQINFGVFSEFLKKIKLNNLNKIKKNKEIMFINIVLPRNYSKKIVEEFIKFYGDKIIKFLNKKKIINLLIVIKNKHNSNDLNYFKLKKYISNKIDKTNKVFFYREIFKNFYPIEILAIKNKIDYLIGPISSSDFLIKEFLPNIKLFLSNIITRQFWIQSKYFNKLSSLHKKTYSNGDYVRKNIKEFANSEAIE